MSLEATRKRIRGPVYSVITPFRGDESVDFEALETYLSLCSQSGAKAFYVMAYNSRYSSLSEKEILELNGFVTRCVRALDPNALVIVGDPLHCSTDTSIAFARRAEEDGADLISLIFREKYYSNQQVVDHYRRCADGSEIGILVHEMPFLSGKDGSIVGWPLDLLDEIADIEQVIAIKEDAKDDEFSRNAVTMLADRLGIIISGGGKRQWLRFQPLGCQAWLNGIGVFDPRIPTRFFKAFETGDSTTVEFILNRIERPFFDNLVGRFGWHLAAKLMIEANGIFQRKERGPMMELSDDAVLSVSEEIREIQEACDALFRSQS